MSAKQSPALKFLQAAWDGIPSASWRRTNGAMAQALSAAIGGEMIFEPGDIQYVYRHFDAGYWIGESHTGYYASACGGERGSSNISAAIAFETWYQRPAYLWAERVKTPERLHVGSRFTWQGHLVTVTSFSEDGKSLTACTYKERAEHSEPEERKVGTLVYLGYSENRRIEAYKRTAEDVIMLRLSAKVANAGDTSSIARRFTIKHEELKTLRAEYDRVVRDLQRRINATETPAALETLVGQIAPSVCVPSMRHFDVETVRAAIIKRRDYFQKAEEEANDAASRDAWIQRNKELASTHDADLSRWMAGEAVARHFNVVRLRVKGAWVETSTGQRASLDGVRLTLRFIKARRKKGWRSTGKDSHDLDEFALMEINPRGVQVGCTFVEWSEIDRLAKEVK